jgi:hypothetical protein
VEIGVHADGRDDIEIIVPVAEVVEIIFDLAGEIFHQPEFVPAPTVNPVRVSVKIWVAAVTLAAVVRRSSVYLTSIQAPPALA